MPIYSYQCNKCKKKFELLVGVTADSADLKCTYCKSSDIKKVLSAFSVRRAAAAGLKGPAGACPPGGCPTCF